MRNLNARKQIIRNGSTERGQTLIIAMIILGLLLILGFVFLGIVDRNIRGGGNARIRSQSNDLAQAGIRFAQQQLLDSPAGADWRGAPTILAPAGTGTLANYTTDPDAYYLRPASGVALPNNPNQLDLGGPDGLGPYVRINFDQGRSLVRVRYGPSDANIFNASPVGPLRNPGLVRNYLILEAVGRHGVINPNDPTTMAPGNGIQFQGYTNTAQLQTALSELKQFDSQNPNSRHLEAFATTGLIDNARYITNKFNVNRPADIGSDNPLVNGNEYLPGVGVDYNGSDIGSSLTYQVGTSQQIGAPSTNQVPLGFGSLLANCDVTFHGNSQFNLNSSFGDGLRVAGNIVGDENATLMLNISKYVPGSNSWTTQSASLSPNQFDTRSPNYNTEAGVLEDGYAGTDQQGFSRGVGRLVPPSILRQDPQSGLNRYRALTAGNTAAGLNGHGNGVYVANTADIQEPVDESGRAGAGSTNSLIYDWMNPNNGTMAATGWQGPFYVPAGAFVQLLPDGFTVQLDQGTWPDQSTNLRRYRIGLVGSQQYIMDSGEDPVDINNSTGLPFASKGMPFNGVLYFEGNVRVRGTIPTDVQLTLVSGATIYIEGPVVKGTTGNDVTDAYPSGSPLFANYNSPLTRLTKSTLMLMARDYVAVNTTQFFGLQATVNVTNPNDQPNAAGFNPMQLAASPSQTGDVTFQADLLTDYLSGTAGNPSSYVPYAMEYTDSLNSNTPLNTKLLLTHTNGQGDGAAFIAMNINLGVYGGNQSASSYYFPGSNTATAPYPNFNNTASNYLFQLQGTPVNSSIPIYGLGIDPWQQYGKFESRGFDLLYPSLSSYDHNSGIISSSAANTNYLLAAGTNTFTIRSANAIPNLTSQPYDLARAALAPNDVRIEASVYAEEGSFVVIPGPWFNPNPNDTRSAYSNRVNQLVGAGASQTQAASEANLERQADYGNAPEIPFYGEPIDVRVQVIGSVSENMPPPLSVQNEWVKKWGWIPVSVGVSGNGIPIQHVPAGTTVNASSIVPNLIVSYDPALVTGRAGGFSATNSTVDLLRTDEYGRALLPMPRLPVSPALTYFGDVQ